MSFYQGAKNTKLHLVLMSPGFRLALAISQMILKIPRSTSQIFCRMSLIWYLAHFLAMIRLGVLVFRKRPQKSTPIFNTSYQRYKLDLFFFQAHTFEVLRLEDEPELQLLAYTTATTTQDPSHICDLHRSSQQCQIANLLSEGRNRTYILMDPSQI